MATRPSRADSLMASLNKGIHVETADKIASGLSNDLSIGRSGGLSNDLTDGLTTAGSTELTNGRTNEPTAGQSENRTDEQSVARTGGNSSERSSERTSGRSEGPAARSIWAPLTEYQGRVLQYLYEVADGLTNVDTISSETVIAYGTVRKCLDVLTKEGYMTDKRRFNGHAFNGFEYWLNNHLCSIYLTRVKSGQPVGQSLGRTDRQSVGRSSGRTIGLTNERAVPFSSSSFSEEIKPTTTQAVVEGTVLSGPVGAYWEEEGLGEAQTKKWCTQFEIDPEQMRAQLDWARFDLETNNRREAVTKDPISWFFGHLRTTGGCFPRPVNYKSATEIRAAAFLDQQKRDAEAKAVLEAGEFETNFKAFLSDPEAQLFKDLFEQLSGFAKEQFAAGERMMAEIELKELFKESKR